MGERSPSIARRIESSIPGVSVMAAKGFLYLVGGSLMLMAGLELKDGVESLAPQMKCIGIPPGLGPEQALREAGLWDPVDPYPIEVRVAQPDGYVSTHRADNPEEFYGPYGSGEFNFGNIPYEVQTVHGPIQSEVCYDRRPPQPTPISNLPKGKDRHLVGTRPMRGVSRLVYSSSVRR